MTPAIPRPYSAVEERVNCISHGLGALGSLLGLVFVLPTAAKHSIGTLLACTVYGVTLVLMFVSSAAYHSVPVKNLRLKQRLRMLDHATIFLLIAGTYTAFAANLRQGGLGYAALAAMWALCVVGIFGVLRHGQPRRGPVIPSLVMGALVMLVVPQLARDLPFWGVVLFVAGAAFYVLGVPFYMWRRLPHHHGIWHAFVIAASVTHFAAVALFVAP